MSFTLAPTTMLEAVNELLTAIGTVPVNTLDAPGSSDVAIAKDTIESVSRETQSRGWWFNTEFSRSFVPSNNEITVPAHVLSVRPSRGTHAVNPETKQFVLKGDKLFSPIEQSFTFTDSVKADVTVLLDFDHLPESARRFITVRAARVFQTKVLGDDQLGVFTAQHELEAWSILEEDHAVSSPMSDMYMQRVRRMGSMMRTDPVSSAQPSNQRGR